jgi:hypothetical protein
MSSQLQSSNDQIDAVLRAEPPVQGAMLDGWVTFCEWMKPDGERLLVLLGKPEENLTQLKGYVHSGLLNMVCEKYQGPGAAGIHVTERR